MRTRQRIVTHLTDGERWEAGPRANRTAGPVATEKNPEGQTRVEGREGTVEANRTVAVAAEASDNASTPPGCILYR